MHPTNPSLRPVAALPLLPDLAMMREHYVDVLFDHDPAADLAGGNVAKGRELVGTSVCMREFFFCCLCVSLCAPRSVHVDRAAV